MGGFCDVLEYVLLRRRMLPMKPRFLGELGESSLAGLSGRSGPALRRLPLDSALPSLTCGAALPLVPFVMPRLRRAASIAFSMSEGSGTTGRDCLLRPREALRGSSSSSSERSVESPSCWSRLLGMPRTGVRSAGITALELGSSSSESAKRLRKKEGFWPLVRSSSSESSESANLDLNLEAMLLVEDV